MQEFERKNKIQWLKMENLGSINKDEMGEFTRGMKSYIYIYDTPRPTREGRSMMAITRRWRNHKDMWREKWMNLKLN